MLTYITTSNLYWNRFEIDKLKSMPFTAAEVEKCTVKKGDLLVCEGGEIGRAAICNYDDEIRIQNHIHRLRVFIKLNIEFYYHVFYLYKLTDMINGKGIGIQGLSSNQLHSIPIPLPPLQEQHRIVDKLNELLSFVDNIETDKTTLQDLIKQTKSKILDLAIRGKLVPQDPNDEPASVLLERIRVEKEELIRQGKIKRDKKESVIFKGEDNSYYETIGNKTTNIDDEIPFDLPEGWEWCRLSDIALILNGDRGQNYPAKSKLQAEGIPFVSASNIDNGFVSSKELLCLTENQYNALGAGKLKKDDIVYCIRGSLGKCGIFNFEKGAIASSLVIVRTILTSAIITNYIFCYLNSYLSESEIKKYDNGSAQPNLAAKDFMRFYFPLPPLPEQTRIVKAIETAFTQLDVIANSIT